jgi:hypothetical protein
MRLFVTVSAGERAGLSRPILAISDQQVVAEMLRPLGRMFDACSPVTADEGSTTPLAVPQRRKATRGTTPAAEVALARQG